MIQISPLALATREEFYSRLLYPSEAIRLPLACVKRLIGYQIMPPA